MLEQESGPDRIVRDFANAVIVPVATADRTGEQVGECVVHKEQVVAHSLDPDKLAVVGIAELEDRLVVADLANQEEVVAPSQVEAGVGKRLGADMLLGLGILARGDLDNHRRLAVGNE